jgi:hypothetical protein
MRTMTKKDGGRARFGLICVLAMAALVGCQENSTGYGAISPVTPAKPSLDLSASSGVPVAPPGPVDVPSLAATRSLGSRGSNAFALTPEERAFDMSQTTENLLASAGGFRLEIVPTLDDPGEQPPVVEPVPNWRLSGVLIGNGVMALLDTGAQTYEIRPGMMVPGTEWRVVAIDADRALLARDGNKLPREFFVGLSGPITGPGVTVQGGGGAGGGTGGTGGGPGGAPSGGPPRGGRGGLGG